MSEFYGNRAIWKSQIPIDYIDTSLVINTPETVAADLSAGDPARLWYVIIEQTNNGAAVEDIELLMTVNGTVYTFAQGAAASGTRYHGYFTYAQTGSDFSPAFSANIITLGSAMNDLDHAIPFTAETIGLITTQQTTAVDGVAAQIEVNITWDKLTQV